MPDTSRTAAARRAFLAKFADAEERAEHFRQLGERAAERRLTLSADEVDALARAYALIDRIYQRHQAKLSAAVEGEAIDV